MADIEKLKQDVIDKITKIDNFSFEELLEIADIVDDIAVTKIEETKCDWKDKIIADQREAKETQYKAYCEEKKQDIKEEAN